MIDIFFRCVVDFIRKYKEFLGLKKERVENYNKFIEVLWVFWDYLNIFVIKKFEF